MIHFSLEVFPSQTKGAYYSLQKALDSFAMLNPRFLSVTCGAGGNHTHNLTQDLVIKLSQRYDFPIAAHMTCIQKNRKTIDHIADTYWHAGIRHIIAIRGDPPKGQNNIPHPQGYPNALELVKALKKHHNFDISVAAYPETHPLASSADADLDFLKQKIDAGANRAISQFFFDPEVFLRFRDRAQKAGISLPILPGCLPILDFKKLQRFAKQCHAHIPDFLHTLFDKVEKKSLDHYLLAMNVLNHQISMLIREGITEFHFYTLNETILIKHICQWLRERFR